MADDADKKAQDLKARLGLLDPKRSAAATPKAAAQPASAASEGGAAQGDSHDLTASPAASAATSAASGSVAGQPQVYTEPDVDEEPESDAFTGGASDGAVDPSLLAPPRTSRAPLAAGVALLVLAGAGGGYFIGSVFSSRTVENARVADAIAMRDYIQNHKHPQTQLNTLESIGAHQAAIAAFAIKAREAREKNDLVSLQSDLLAFLKTCQEFQIAFDLEGAMNTPFYAGDLVPGIARMSASLARFAAANEAVAREASLIAYVFRRQSERAANPGGTTRRFLVGEQVIDDVPWGTGVTIAKMDTPKADVNEETGESLGWQVAVLEEGKEVGKMVRTTDVVLINIEAELRELEAEVQKLAVLRVLERVKELEDVSKLLDVEGTLKKIAEVAGKPTYFTF